MKKKSPLSILQNNLVLGLLSDATLVDTLMKFIAEERDEIFKASLPNLLRKKRIRSVIPAFYTRINDFSTKAFVVYTEISRLAYLYVELIKSQKEDLQKFVLLRDKIEYAILIADYASAKANIDEVENKFGESIWLSRTKMLVLSAIGDTVAFQEYCKHCEHKSQNSFNSFIFKCSQLIADSGNASLQLGTVVGRNVNELREAKKGYLASLLEVLFYPHPLEPITNPVECFFYINAYPIIDQYTIISLLIRYELTKKQNSEEILSTMQLLASELTSIISDEKMANLCSIENTLAIGPTLMAPLSTKIYNQYNLGQYNDAVESFYNKHRTDRNILPSINVTAKAMAYADFESALDTRDAPIIGVANSLATIYSLSPLWNQAEEELVSLCIKYNHLSLTAHIQLALFKSLPFRYSPDSQKQAAKIAISYTSECTPQTYHLAKDDVFSDGVTAQNIKVPAHRKLKTEILKQLSSNTLNLTLLDELLLQLKSSECLLKDIIECHTRFFLKSKNDIGLLHQASIDLVADSNRFICYPMDYLITKVEDLQLYDLDALIIAHHYNKSVSDERDYILNEGFEEYLLGSGVTRPSQLLLSYETLKNKEIVFFRDICIPEVMDYLDCFQNSNELRSERIIILDELEKRDQIDPKTRMREVEDIVRQVIVDTGTSEFNGAKIFVNDSAIKKKHLEELNSLLSLYQKLPENTAERYTKIDEHSKGGYISGSKNSLVERLYVTLSNSFLFDDKYGLDKNLSAEIRHGFFSNLMRARLEELHLLTELDDKGQYLKNQYWREQNSLVREAFWNNIDDTLKNFSKSFDSAVAEAEEWMKINIRSEKNERMFIFDLSIAEFNLLKTVVEIIDEADPISSYVLDLLWRKTESALEAVRERLNGEFKQKIDDIFDKTIGDILTTKGQLPLRDLMQAFTRARNEIKEDINTASEWFNRSENTEITAGSLDRLIDIAVRSFEKVRGNAYTISIATPPELSAVSVNKQVAKPFILAIINLLDNCYVHSGLGQATRVEITGHLENGLATVTIKNNLSIEKQSSLDENSLNLIKTKLSSSDVSKHIRGEGGTGLIKASHEITYLGKNASLDISRVGEFFHAAISYNHEVSL